MLQRGDAEVSQKLWRVVRACVELGERNPIEQIHDQGAGGNCNVVKEIIYPLGALRCACCASRVMLGLPAEARSPAAAPNVALLLHRPVLWRGPA